MTSYQSVRCSWAAKSCLLFIILGLVMTISLAEVPSALAQDANQAETHQQAVAGQANSQIARPNFKLPKMFDFERFKRIFSKAYSSSLEEMRRLKLFLARSWRAFISAVGYKHGSSSYYLSVNDRSDATQDELKRGENRFLAQDDSADLTSQDEEDAYQDEPLSLEALEGEIAKIEQRADEPGYAQLAEELRKARGELTKTRRRRSTDSAADIERAFNNAWFGGDTGGDDDESPPAAIAAKTKQQVVKPRVVSELAKSAKDPKFVIPKDRRLSDGEWRNYSQLPVKSQYKVETLMDRFFKIFKQPNRAPSASSKNEDDVVWVDHRQSGCLAEVQNQWFCGSCYAFTLTSFFEWAHCKETGNLTKFSEQYMLDCGPKVDLHGCLGGRVDRAGTFVANFGLELASLYPYAGYRQMCPYAPETSMTHMGYVRLNVGDVSRVPLGYAEEYLKHTPMVVTTDIAGDFVEYGGGVWDGRKCKSMPAHAMLLVGHGREDGEEYWLIRNSWGPLWGEAGYLKLNKNSRCINPSHGLIWGTGNGKDFSQLSPRRNEHVAEPVAKDVAYQLKNMKYTAETLGDYINKRMSGQIKV